MPDGDILYTESVRSRVRVAARNNRLGPVGGRSRSPWQAVMKICDPRIKAPRYARLVARYIARLRDCDRETGAYGSVAVYDECGTRLSPEALTETLEEWNLVRNRDNLSPMAKRLSGAERRGLPENERLHRSQAIHLTWSVDGDQEPAGALTTARVEETTQAIVDELLTSRGYRAIWGVHAELDHEGGGGSHTHAHILIKRAGPDGALVTGPRFIESFRHLIEQHGRASGLNVVAERRADREDYREAIVNGMQEPTKPRRPSGKQGHDGNLMRRAPAWWALYGEEVERRRDRERMKELNEEYGRREDREPGLLGRVLGKGLINRPKEKQRRPVPALMSDVRAAIADSFHDPDGAAVAYWDLAWSGASQDRGGEWTLPNKKLADWYMLNRPAVFGEVKGRALAHRIIPDVRLALRSTLAGMVAAPGRDLRAAVRDTPAPAMTPFEGRKIYVSLTRLAEDARDELRDENAAEQIHAVAASFARTSRLPAEATRGPARPVQERGPSTRAKGRERGGKDRSR